jgi:hypothetical protein
MPSRRDLLTATGATATAIVTAGCLESLDSDAGGTPAGTEPTPTRNGTARDEQPTTTPALAPGDRARGEAEPIATEETVTDDQYEYVESNDTVRYPATMSGGEVASYGYTPFDEWSETEGASVGSMAVLDRLETRLESTASIGGGFGRRDDADGLAVSVTYATLQDREGNVIDEPEVPVERVLAETPRAVEAQVEFAGRSGSHSYPVVVWNTVLQQE